MDILIIRNDTSLPAVPTGRFRQRQVANFPFIMGTEDRRPNTETYVNLATGQ
jgi:hypothetical protein